MARRFKTRKPETYPPHFRKLMSELENGELYFPVTSESQARSVIDAINKYKRSCLEWGLKTEYTAIRDATIELFDTIDVMAQRGNFVESPETYPITVVVSHINGLGNISAKAKLEKEPEMPVYPQQPTQEEYQEIEDEDLTDEILDILQGPDDDLAM